MTSILSTLGRFADIGYSTYLPEYHCEQILRTVLVRGRHLNFPSGTNPLFRDARTGNHLFASEYFGGTNCHSKSFNIRLQPD